MAAEAVQIDLDQIGVGGADFALLAHVLLAIRVQRFAAGAEEFDDGDDAVAALPVDDFEEHLGHPIRLGLDEERLLHGDADFRLRFQAALRGEFDHAHVGKEWMIGDSLRRLQKDALLDAGANAPGRTLWSASQA